MDPYHIQAPPFTTCVLQDKRDFPSHALRPHGHVPYDSLLPASYRVVVNQVPRLFTPNLHDDDDFLERELDLRRLDSIFNWLWVTGRPMPPRPLHYQLVLGREITVAERMDMHLVWTTGRIFLKPVPRFLLHPRFWRDHLSCREDCPCLPRHDDADVIGNITTKAQEAAGGGGVPQGGCRQGLRARALGFLCSYTALVSHESDFLIARDRHLLPREVEWPAWRALVRQLLMIEDIDRKVDARFIYGELRLSRLNKIYMLARLPFLRGYLPHWQQYGTYFRDNLAWLATGTVYIAIVLTAIQVGQATSLAGNDRFQSASYGFTIFSILFPLIACLLILLVFSYKFVDNFIEAARYRNQRFRAIQIESARP
ncbi:hypothetical protein VMCG_09992 [Cytospora schulzeri]|uniref:Subtilisin-like serine protease n=1 Tax=Cytospora schulzeri TaxID=448051 RepID=A0A423VIU6_9PEZI|nr:hypothetical protein VMCG_09992 [Valsa malicola]